MSTPSTNDWASQLTSTLERLVTTVRDRATGPALTAVRAIVFGLLLTILGVVAIVLLAAGSVRFLDSYVPGDVWSAHLITGAVFTLAGLFLFSRRHRAEE